VSKRYGMVYMGSKEKILPLIDYIFLREANKENFIDLFCGGFSVSGFALRQSKFNVYANDINHYTIALIKEIMSGGEKLRAVKFDWIPRETFVDVFEHPENYEDWYVGYVLNVWSFGCNQKDYMYAKDLEASKRALHMAIVFDDMRPMMDDPRLEEFVFVFYDNSRLRELDYKQNTSKRVAFLELFHKFIRSKEGDEQSFLFRLEQLPNLSLTEHLDAIGKSKKHSERLILSHLDWKDALAQIPAEVLEKSFIYCDPPYQDAKEYLFGNDFDYDTFWQWFRTCPYSVYVSSYKAPADVEPLNFEMKAQLLDNGHRGDNKPKKFVKENIYWNGKGEVAATLYDVLFGDATFF